MKTKIHIDFLWPLPSCMGFSFLSVAGVAKKKTLTSKKGVSAWVLFGGFYKYLKAFWEAPL